MKINNIKYSRGGKIIMDIIKAIESEFNHSKPTYNRY